MFNDPFELEGRYYILYLNTVIYYHVKLLLHSYTEKSQNNLIYTILPKVLGPLPLHTHELKFIGLNSSVKAAYKVRSVFHFRSVKYLTVFLVYLLDGVSLCADQSGSSTLTRSPVFLCMDAAWQHFFMPFS